MNTLVMGVFKDTVDADKTIEDLKALGYGDQNISVIAKDSVRTKITQTDTGASSAGDGMVAGATIGGLAGLLIGIATAPVGGLLIAGPLAATLGISTAAATTVGGVAAGAAAGGLVGALVGLGLSEDEAKVYEEYINNEGVLVAVNANEGQVNDVENVFVDNQADEVRTKVS